MFSLCFGAASAERDWAAFEKKIAEKMKAKNLIYKEKDNKLKAELSDRLKKLVKVKPRFGSLEDRIFRYIDRGGQSIFSDRAKHRGYKRIILRSSTKHKSGTVQKGSFLTQRKRYGPTVKTIANRHRVSPDLVHAIISAESGYNANAVSKAGAVGLMQLMPATARRYGVKNRKNPVDSLNGGTQYFRALLDLFDEDVKLALAAYNAGENAVIKYGRRIPPYKETQRYVKRVLKYYDEYAKSSGKAR